MRLLVLLLLLCASPAFAQLGTPDPNVGGGNAVSAPITVHKPADPDQPQHGMYCMACRAGGPAIFCAICGMQRAWDGLGDWF